MILPIYAYGMPVLRRKAKPIETGTDLSELISNMFETMYAANGVGLAAPQIGKSIRLFVVDAEPMDEENLKGFKKVFINAQVVEETGNAEVYQEGCLSIPQINEEVTRQNTLRIRYFDENWGTHEETFEGLAARVIQHEYDHIEGVLFTDHLTPLKRRLLKGRLGKISKGKINSEYRMKFSDK